MATELTSQPNPKDESLAAFKTWITDMTLRMAGKSDDSMTEEKWIERWELYWEKDYIEIKLSDE
jgi:hypothetical protein